MEIKIGDRVVCRYQGVSYYGEVVDTTTHHVTIQNSIERLTFTMEDVALDEDYVGAQRKFKEVRTTSSTGGQKGVKEAAWHLIPAMPMHEVAVLFGRGARKYADHNWRNGYEWSKSIAAMHRHQNAFEQGIDYDVCSNDPGGCQFFDNDGNPWEPIAEDTCYNHTGCHHMTAVVFHGLVLLEFKKHHPDYDDRYIPGRGTNDLGSSNDSES